MLTFLHHSDPTIPHYRAGQWTFLRGALATVDRPLLGWIGRMYFHNVCYFGLTAIGSFAEFTSRSRTTTSATTSSPRYHFVIWNSHSAVSRILICLVQTINLL
jgi:hypothetical protein